MTDDWSDRVRRASRGVGAVMARLEGLDVDDLLGTDEVQVIMTGWDVERDYADGAGVPVSVTLRIEPRSGERDA